MSSSKSFKHWLKGKKSVDFTHIPLKADIIPAKVAPPVKKTNLADIPNISWEKPVVDFRPFLGNPEHDIARALWKAAEKRPHSGFGQSGRYFNPDGSARCIIGALILQQPNGRHLRDQVRATGINAASSGAVMRFLPAEWNTSMGRCLIHSAQAMNDGGVPWHIIAERISERVGYRRPVAHARAA